MGSPKFEIAEQIKMWIVVYLVCFLALYCVLSAALLNKSNFC